MRAFRLATGEILHPEGVYGRGIIGDRMVLAAPGTDLFRRWEKLAEPAGPQEEAYASRLRAPLDNSRR